MFGTSVYGTGINERLAGTAADLLISVAPIVLLVLFNSLAAIEDAPDQQLKLQRDIASSLGIQSSGTLYATVRALCGGTGGFRTIRTTKRTSDSILNLY